MTQVLKEIAERLRQCREDPAARYDHYGVHYQRDVSALLAIIYRLKWREYYTSAESGLVRKQKAAERNA